MCESEQVSDALSIDEILGVNLRRHANRLHPLTTSSVDVM